MTRVVFMGSPEFGVPSLRALTREHDVTGVVTQPDRPAGRGRAVTAPAVKQEAQLLGIPVLQPAKLSDPFAVNQLREWRPDLIVVAAFGQILRREVLELPPLGCINVHASLLPRWRGAAPIQAAIAAGDAETGVTIMKMDEGLDTGGILLQKATPILAHDTGATLTTRLADLGAELLPPALKGHISGELKPAAQDSSQATKAPQLKKEDGRLDGSLPAAQLERRVRAFNPWPGAYIEWERGRLKIHGAHVLEIEFTPGQRVIFDGLPGLGTSKGTLVLDEVQPEGKRSMDGRLFVLGARGWVP